MTGISSALVIGATGQDGTLLCRQLAETGCHVSATGRSLDVHVPPAWDKLGLTDLVTRHRLDPCDHHAVAALIARTKADAIFLLAAQSSVGRSFREPAETFRSNVVPLIAVLEAARTVGNDPAIIYPASGECFGESTADRPITETSSFAPRSPYAAAKCMAVQVARSYRDSYGTRVSIAYLFGHESPLRPESFVFGKLLKSIAAIHAGEQDVVEFQDLSVVRDWGWAPDYTAAMIALAQIDPPQEIILATGQSCSLETAVRAVMDAAGLAFDKCARVASGDTARNRDLSEQWVAPSLARQRIGWTGSTAFPALAQKLLDKLPES